MKRKPTKIRPQKLSLDSLHSRAIMGIENVREVIKRNIILDLPAIHEALGINEIHISQKSIYSFIQYKEADNTIRTIADLAFTYITNGKDIAAQQLFTSIAHAALQAKNLYEEIALNSTTIADDRIREQIVENTLNLNTYTNSIIKYCKFVLQDLYAVMFPEKTLSSSPTKSTSYKDDSSSELPFMATPPIRPEYLRMKQSIAARIGLKLKEKGGPLYHWKNKKVAELLNEHCRDEKGEKFNSLESAMKSPSTRTAAIEVKGSIIFRGREEILFNQVKAIIEVAINAQ